MSHHTTEGRLARRRRVHRALTLWAMAALVLACQHVVQPRPLVPPLAPDLLPVATLDSLGTFSLGRIGVVQHMVAVAFERGTPQAARQAAIQSINGIVIGGIPIDDVNGEYLVRIPGGTLSDINNAIAALKKFSTVIVVQPVVYDTIGLANRRTPQDGAGRRPRKLNPDSGGPSRFQPGTSPPARQDAIDGLNGRDVGGVHTSPG